MKLQYFLAFARRFFRKIFIAVFSALRYDGEIEFINIEGL